MPLPEEFLQQLRSKCPITDVVSGYVNLRRRGSVQIGLCPFHNEKTPSFTVYPRTESFYCFGCAAGGDVITFIRRAENLDYIAAVKLLAQRAGLEMPRDTYYDDSAHKLRLRIFEANREAARFYYSTLYSEQGAHGLDYLRSRQLSEHTIRTFGLGFAPDSWDALSNRLKEMGFSDYELVQANLAAFSKKGGVYDRFRNRVMFPIIDVRGNVVAFGGRVMTDEKPKYLNTSDTPAFKKSSNLFALNKAKNAHSDKLILCEGYMDVIALHQAGFDYAVATLGTALTEEQAGILRRYTDTVALCYDSDSAGQKATERAIDILRGKGVKVRVLSVPDGKDPDEFIKRHGDNGAIKFKQLLENAQNDLEYRLTRMKSGYDLNSADGKADYMTRAAKLLSTLDNEIEANVYAGRLCEEYGVDRRLFDEQCRRYREQNRQSQEKSSRRKITTPYINSDGFGGKQSGTPTAGIVPTASTYAGMAGGADVPTDVNHAPSNSRGVQTPQMTRGKPIPYRARKAEESLIAYLINNPDAAQRLSRELPPEKMVTDSGKRVYSAVLTRILSGRSAMLIDISGELSEEETSRVSYILSQYKPELESPKTCGDYIKVIQEEGERVTAEDMAQNSSDEEISAYLKSIGQKKRGH